MRQSQAYSSCRYVHANYRFIVDPREEYYSQAIDADFHLDWSNVLQILVSAQSQSASCPICLSTPVAPRMAKCGHIFCLPCLIRYMHSTDETNPVPERRARWKKCPICWDSVYMSDTRPARWFVGQEAEVPREGGDVVLRLMVRQPNSTLALPRDGAESLPKMEDIPWFFAAEVSDYARIMKGTEEYMLSQFCSEIEELQKQEKEDELMFGEETVWSRKAVTAIKEAKERVKGIGNPPSASAKPELEGKKPKRLPTHILEMSPDVPDFYHIQRAAKSGQSVPEDVRSSWGLGSQQSTSACRLTESTQEQIPSLGDPEISSSQRRLLLNDDIFSARTSQHHTRIKQTDHHQVTEQPFFFYQALLHYYLSPLDIRILKAAFGEFALFPTTILPRVERVSTGHIVDDELRKRAKYLAHLPYGCEVSFLECNWADVVSPEVLTTFEAEIGRRRKKNRDKEASDERARIRAEKEEDDKRWAAARRKRPSFSRDRAEVDFQDHKDPGHPASSDEVINFSSSPPWFTHTQNGSAFASLASPSTSPVAPRTIWGTTAILPSSPPSHPVDDGTLNTETDGWLQGWERDLLGEEDLNSRIQATSINEGTSQLGATSGNGKKKKNKKITLMTTNARRGA